MRIRLQPEPLRPPRAEHGIGPERQDGHEDGLLVNVPAEHEGGQSADQQAAQEAAAAAWTPPDGGDGRLQRGRKNIRR